jgi:hypothetical protein
MKVKRMVFDISEEKRNNHCPDIEDENNPPGFCFRKHFCPPFTSNDLYQQWMVVQVTLNGGILLMF